jgi:hypothetical protein
LVDWPNELEAKFLTQIVNEIGMNFQSILMSTVNKQNMSCEQEWQKLCGTKMLMTLQEFIEKVQKFNHK